MVFETARLSMIELTPKPIDVSAALEAVRSPDAGAVVLFLGTARATTGGRRSRSLDYEAYPEMARAKLVELERQARARWPLIECVVLHRVGHVEIGEVSVALAVSSAHRKPAFEAGQWLIDHIKQVVPIWKRENWADGTGEWVHPGLAPPETGPSPSRGTGVPPVDGAQAENADRGEQTP